MWYERLLNSFVSDDDSFISTLCFFIDEKGYTTKSFAMKCSIPEGTMYKLVSKQRKEPQSSTIRKILKTVKRLEYNDDSTHTIAVIQDKHAQLHIDPKKANIFTFSSIQELLLSCRQAINSGAEAIYCSTMTDFLSELFDFDIKPISALDETIFEK